MNKEFQKSSLTEAFCFAVSAVEGLLRQAPPFPGSKDPEADRNREVEEMRHYYTSVIKPRLIQADLEAESYTFVSASLRQVWEDTLARENLGLGVRANTRFVQSFTSYLKRVDSTFEP